MSTQVPTSRGARILAGMEGPKGTRYGVLALLGIATVISLLTADLIGQSTRDTAILLGGAAFTACWIGWFTTGPRDERHPGTYLIGRVVLAASLTWVNPFMAIFAFAGWLDGYGRLKRPALAFVFVVTALTMAGSQSGGMPPEDGSQWVVFGVLALVNLGLAALFTALGVRDQRVSEGRANTISELERTNARLEAALAENASLHEQLLVRAREAGVTEERERLAREIHDTIAQGLAGIVTQLQAATEATGADAARTHVDRAAALARDSLEEARRSVRGLRPQALDDDPLPAALKRLTSTWSRRHGVPVQCAVTGTEEPLHPEVEATLLRVAQESLNNVAKHARATRVGVTLSFMEDDIVLDVRDDGVGFDPTRAPLGDGGFGLASMRQRVERMAGSLVLEAVPGQGVAVSARVPSVRDE